MVGVWVFFLVIYIFCFYYFKIFFWIWFIIKNQKFANNLSILYSGSVVIFIKFEHPQFSHPWRLGSSDFVYLTTLLNLVKVPLFYCTLFLPPKDNWTSAWSLYSTFALWKVSLTYSTVKCVHNIFYGPLEIIIKYTLFIDNIMKIML